MKLLLLLSILSSIAFANLQILEVHDMDLTYLKPEGNGKIGKFKFGVDTGPNKETEDPGDFLHDIFIKIVGNDIFLESDFSYVVWRDAPGFFTDTEKIITRDLEFYFTLPRNSLKAKRLQYDFSEAKFQLFDLDALCSDKQRVGGIAQRLLENCLFNSHLKMSKLVFNFPKKVVNEVVERSHGELSEGPFTIDTVRDFDLTVVKSNATATFTVDWAVNLKSTLIAKLTPLIEQNKLKIDVDKIKLGKINVTKLTLWVLSQFKISNLKIEGKTVTISF
jgi:hypothetical protein